MEFGDLLQLAKGNSTLAKRKSEKLNGSEGGGSNVSSKAVAQFLEKRKREKEEKKRAEEEAKRKRIEARVNANVNVVEKKKEKPKPSKESSDIKFKVHDLHKVKKEKRKEDVGKSKDKPPEKSFASLDKRQKQQQYEKLKSKEMKLNKHKNEHRKEKERIPAAPTREKKPDIKDPSKKHKRKKQQSSTNNGLNFMDLMKLASENSKNPGAGSALKKELLKKQQQQKLKDSMKSESISLDPDRDVKLKRKHKHLQSHDEPPVKQKRPDHSSKKMPREKEILPPKHLPKNLQKHRPHSGSASNKNITKNGKPQQKIASKDLSRCEMSEKPRGGLLVETVSVTKSNGQKIKEREALPSRKGVEAHAGKSKMQGSRNVPLNVKNGKMQNWSGGGIASQNRGGGGSERGIAAQFRGTTQNQGGGIAAQNGSGKNPGSNKKTGSTKKTADEYEDEFEKEEKMLARQRKLFEMRRATGNKNLTEEDLFVEDYDLDDEEEEDSDFIDDTECNDNYSRHISAIFGYDRRRFDDSDSDLDNMESSYAQIEKEEARSARIAKIEDEYEKMKEEEELARIKARKKK